MVRNYKRKKEIRYSELKLLQGLRLVHESKMSFRRASKICGVPTSTLHRWAKEEDAQPGEFRSGRFKPSLSPKEEEKFVYAIKIADELGWQYGTKEIKAMIKSYLDSFGRKTVFKNNLPGRDWFASFKKRWSNKLPIKQRHTLSNNRTVKLGRKDYYNFFRVIRSIFEEYEFFHEDNPSDRIFSCVEVRFSTDVNSEKLIFNRLLKGGFENGSNIEKTMPTVLFTGSAARELLPLLVVFKKDTWHERFTTSGCVNGRYYTTKSGWIDEMVFENWFTSLFVPYVSHKRKPVLLFYDGLGFSLTKDTVNAAKKANIIIIRLPLYSNHLLNPLHIALVKPLEDHWRHILNKIHLMNEKFVNNAVFMNLLPKLYEVFSTSKIIDAFRKCGIWPFDPDVTKEDMNFAESPIHDSFADKDGVAQESVINSFKSPLSCTSRKTIEISEENDECNDEMKIKVSVDDVMENRPIGKIKRNDRVTGNEIATCYSLSNVSSEQNSSEYAEDVSERFRRSTRIKLPSLKQLEYYSVDYCDADFNGDA